MQREPGIHRADPIRSHRRHCRKAEQRSGGDQQQPRILAGQRSRNGDRHVGPVSVYLRQRWSVAPTAPVLFILPIIDLFAAIFVWVGVPTGRAPLLLLRWLIASAWLRIRSFRPLGALLVSLRPAVFTLLRLLLRRIPIRIIV